MGILLIKLASDKEYGDMKRSIIKNITQGNKFHLNRKTITYTMLCKYIPELIKKQELVNDHVQQFHHGCVILPTCHPYRWAASSI